MLAFMFKGEHRPDTPDLGVKDSRNKTDIAVSGQTGFDGDFVQTTALAYAPLKMALMGKDLEAGGQSAAQWVTRATKLLAALHFDTTGAVAQVRALYSDHEGNMMATGQQQVTATSFKQNGKFVGNALEFDTFGAPIIAIQIDSITAGKADVYLGGV